MTQLARRTPTRRMCALLAGLALVAGTAAATPAEWRFVVMLGEREIGEHRFRLEPQPEGEAQLRSEARFSVRLLGFQAFSYVHEATERWRGDCLQRIESKTEQNGRPFAVTGTREEDAFRVRTLKSSTDLPGCVMTFAYWNPRIVRQSRLLNPQNGEYEDITVEARGLETVETRQGRREARRYTLVGRKARIDVWYAPDGRWIALESTTEAGQRLRYILA